MFEVRMELLDKDDFHLGIHGRLHKLQMKKNVIKNIIKNVEDIYNLDK